MGYREKCHRKLHHPVRIFGSVYPFLDQSTEFLEHFAQVIETGLVNGKSQSRDIALGNVNVIQGIACQLQDFLLEMSDSLGLSEVSRG